MYKTFRKCFVTTSIQIVVPRSIVLCKKKRNFSVSYILWLNVSNVTSVLEFKFILT